MTQIKFKSKPTWHETGVVDRSSGRPILVAESPVSLLVRLKGTRQVLKVPWEMAYLRAAYAEADRLRREKREAKKAKAEQRKKERASGNRLARIRRAVVR